MKVRRIEGGEFIMELPPEAQAASYKGSFIVAEADKEPFVIVGKKAQVIRYIKPEGE